LEEIPRQAGEQGRNDDNVQVIMAVDLKERGTVGCCYYVAQEEQLKILGDIRLGGKDIIDTCQCFLQYLTARSNKKPGFSDT
jgi:DNA mismatch repair protein MSH5